MNTWNQDLATKAWNFACQRHAEEGQLVPGTKVQYSRHFGSVVMEVMSVLHAEEQEYDANLAVLCAILHDTVEDTKTTPEEIADNFGQAVADGVRALSKKDKASGEPIPGDYFDRIKAQPREVWLVKMADRVVNLQPPPSGWTREKCVNYKEEAKKILRAFRSASAVMAYRLEKKIEQYQIPS